MTCCNFLAVTLSALALSVSAAQTTPAPKKQLPADQRAYQVAQNKADYTQRLAALQQFLHDFPTSNRTGSAHYAIFRLIAEYFPTRTADLDREVKAGLHGAKGPRKWSEETFYVEILALNDTDLQYAEKLGRDAVKHLTESAYDKATTPYYENPKNLSASDRATQHHYFESSRAGALAALGLVELRLNHPDRAKSLADQAYTLDPASDLTSTLLGEVALAAHQDSEALADFERAQVLGALPTKDHDRLLTLYRAAHNGSDAGLLTDLDATYRRLYPNLFRPAQPSPATSAHTALLELYTGSGCNPCVGADLAVEALLDTYPRSQVVVLAFDLHIPDPDPLTNPDTVARANLYNVRFTPNYVLDGTPLPKLYGGVRDQVPDLYGKLLAALTPELARPTAVTLQLSATHAASGAIDVSASVTTPTLPILQQELTPLPPPPPAKDAKPASPGPAPKPAVLAPPPAPATPALVLNFALVQDDLRYSGENGMRFHRMVVRSLAKPAGEGFPLIPAASVSQQVTFQPAQIAAALSTYLDAYEQSNDRFGPIHFLSKDTTLDSSHLAIAAWVQDTATHRILQSAFFPLPAPAVTTTPAAQ